MEENNILKESGIKKAFIILTMIAIIFILTFLILIIFNEYNIIDVSSLISNIARYM